jgi:hypothetical protein
MTNFIFETPNSPEEFGVALAPPELRQLDFSALDYQNLLRAGIEYIRTYHPEKFNDFFASNGTMMMLELVSYIANVLSLRSEVLADESFAPTAQTKEALIQHFELINQKFKRATPATVDIEISIDNTVGTELRVPPGLRFSFPGPDGQPVIYETFRAPGDFTSSISIPPGKRGVIAYGIEGTTGDILNVSSTGGPDQFIDIFESNVLDDPITVEVNVGSFKQIWRRIEILEKAGSQDEVFEVRHLEGRTRIKFGNGVAGKAPIAGEEISIKYRLGGGIRGRIAANTINEVRPLSPLPPSSAVIEVSFRNPVPSQGGTDEESIESARRRAPREFATHNSAISGEDYGLLAANYKHPVFGSVTKAVGTIRTGVDEDIREIADKVRKAPTLDEAVEIMQTEFINRNIVEVYVLAEGPSNTLVKPNAGLRRGLITFFEEINVLTDEVRILDGNVLPIDVEASIIMNRNADPGTVKVDIQEAIVNFFNINNFDMGKPLYLSNLYQVLQSISGVKFVNIFKPVDDIVQLDPVLYPDKLVVRFNEVITLGNVNVRFFFEQGNFRVPPTGIKR